MSGIPSLRLTRPPTAAISIISSALAMMPTWLNAQMSPEPNPPQRPPAYAETVKQRIATSQKGQPPITEWTMHKSTDGANPEGGEQKMLWLMNRARANPTEEGIWLAESNDPDIAGGRDGRNVTIQVLKDAFAALPAKPPAAFDIRLHDASVLHSLDLIARDAQDHNGQFDRIDASGFNCNGGSISVFSFSDSALNAHAALNIDWGNGPDGMQDPPGHRHAIMGVWQFPGPGLTNTGLALVPENDAGTGVGPMVFSGGYCQGGAPDHNRFLVGTVWEDLNGDGDYDENEGKGGVLVMPDEGTYYAITGDAGGYAIPIEFSGIFDVTFSGGDLGTTEITQTVGFGTSSVLLDFKVGDDRDGDGVPNEDDAFPDDPTEWDDTDNDGVGDNGDAFPTNPDETADTDRDGIGNNADPDDDNDGVLDGDDDYPLGRFDDARPDYWAFLFIETFARAGITAGCGNDNYCPGDPVTRAQMAVFLERGMRGSNFSPPAATGNVFLDVGTGDFAASFIEQLSLDGITSGCGNGNYCPNATVTRDQMAVFLLRAKHGSGYSPPLATGIFDDVPLDFWAVRWIEQLAAEGITSGCGGASYCPNAPVKRDQMAVFLVRTFGL